MLVNEERLQVFRHKAGQLDSLKNLDLDELEKLRLANEKSLKVLEEQYWAKRENTLAGKLMRQRLGFSKKSETEAASPPEKDSDSDGKTFGADRIEPDDEAEVMGDTRKRRMNKSRRRDRSEKSHGRDRSDIRDGEA